MKDWIVRFGRILYADVVEYIRVKISIIISLLQPVIMILAFGLSSKFSDGSVGLMPFSYIAPGIFTIAVLYSVTYSAGYTTISDRERRLIDDIVLSPVAYSSFVTARVLGAAVKCILPTLSALILGLLFFEIRVEHIFVFITCYLLTSAACAGLGMMIGAFTNYLGFDGMANFFLVPAMFFGGIFFPISSLKGLGTIIKYLPITPTVELYRFALTGECLEGSVLSNYIILTLYAAFSVMMAVGSFKAAIKKH